MILDEYLSFIIEMEIGFWVSRIDYNNFEPINEVYSKSSPIDNCIIDIHFEISKPILIKEFVAIVQKYKCRHFQMRFYGDPDIDLITHYIRSANIDSARSFEILLRYHKKDYVVEDLFKINPLLNKVVFYNSPSDEVLMDTYKTICYVEHMIGSADCCGKVLKKNLLSNMFMFVESKNYNACLNRKISLDVFGMVKQCPTMVDNYGSVLDVNLDEVIRSDTYKTYTAINKDLVSVCRDCEFRYGCVDCRVFTEEGNLYGKPAKCTYDPYLGTWNDNTNELDCYYKTTLS